MNAKELATQLGRHPNTISVWVTAGLIPVRRRNARVLIFDLPEVEKMMLQNGLRKGKNAPKPTK